MGKQSFDSLTIHCNNLSQRHLLEQSTLITKQKNVRTLLDRDTVHMETVVHTFIKLRRSVVLSTQYQSSQKVWIYHQCLKSFVTLTKKDGTSITITKVLIRGNKKQTQWRIHLNSSNQFMILSTNNSTIQMYFSINDQFTYRITIFLPSNLIIA